MDQKEQRKPYLFYQLDQGNNAVYPPYFFPSPTSQGSQYLAILPSVCMSHGWTNMEQPSFSAACMVDTQQD